jgi:small acid-soluble spore protein F (minor alpha/beta-type SASP)
VEARIKANAEVWFFQTLGGTVMASRGMMSEKLKMEIARELGVYDTVRSAGWGDVTSRDCGNMVRKAIEIAERSIPKQ